MTETTKFEVGDTIWWLDTRSIDKPRIRSNVVLEIEWEKYHSRHKYVIDDNRTYVWSPNTVVAKTKEDLINILCPPKIGLFDHNQLVYVIKYIKDVKFLHITKAYVKRETIYTSEYALSCVKDYEGNTFSANVEDIYTNVEQAKKVIVKWLENNDN